jgi:hypothetical protein
MSSTTQIPWDVVARCTAYAAIAIMAVAVIWIVVQRLGLDVDPTIRRYVMRERAEQRAKVRSGVR